MGRTRATTQQSNRGRSTRRSVKKPRNEQDDIPDIYQDMLAEAARNPLQKPDLQTKVYKRRKLDDGSPQVMKSEPDLADFQGPVKDVASGDEDEPARPAKQTVFDDFGGSDEDSDEDFEDVDLEAEIEANHQHQEKADEPLQIDLSRKPGLDITPSVRRRKPATAIEKKIRLDVHKWHVLCLIAHLQRRNHWCEEEQVQSILKRLVPRNVVKLLHLDANQTQYQRNHSFNTALDEINKIWRSEWKNTEQGIRRAYWMEEPADLQDVDDRPDPIDQDDFRDAAKTRSGSRDLGAQLFCALLRAVAVETRLVCSLQPLPFSGVARGTTPEKPKSQYIMASSLGRQPRWERNGESPNPTHPKSRLYDAEPEQAVPTPPARTPPKRVRDSPYPIFWVEVFNEALQKWIPVDPLVRNTTNKPKTGFEPPANDPLNSMTYVIAFEEDGSAKDVTRRYAQFYNGKTRRNRVESTKGGEKWWKKTMSCFERPFPEDRDAIEDAELLTREESEQMPKNVQDFKNHPHYALERHLRRNEVIHPKREIGKVSVGLSKDAKLEPVFRRRDVLVVKTADQWYRLGRDVRIGEQPLKRVVPRKRRSTPMDDDEEQEEGALLYAEFQTDLYVPPTVVNGRIPRNAYGNLDIYVASMIPAGGIHVQHPDAARAARILGIDYADAVTGFEFKGRQGTAVTNGVVAAAGYRDALVEVLEGIGYERARERSEKRSSIALQMWKKFLTALRIRERVNAKYGEGGNQAEDDADDVDTESYQDDEDVDEEEGGGGFFPERPDGPTSLPQSPQLETSNHIDIFDLDSSADIEVPILIHESPHKLAHEQPQQKSSSALESRKQEPDDAGGFLPPDNDRPNEETKSGGEGRGGFIREDLPFSDPEGPPPSLPRPAISPTPDRSPYPHTNTRSVAAAAAAASSTDASNPSPAPAAPDPAPANNPTHISAPAETQHPDPESESESKSESDSTLEKGSLLSHDPEDSDAEPEWLAQAMDSD